MSEVSKKITGEVVISPEISSDIEKSVEDISSFKKKIEESLGRPVSELIEIFLVGAIRLNASDLHVEPSENDAKIRARLDGILQEVLLLDRKTYELILSRIKLLSGLKLNIEDRPQDGRFSIQMRGTSIEIRTSTLPAEFGEAIVLRILNPKSLIDLDDLGLRKDLLEIFEIEVRKPNGMIIVTGPTGAGKTTTLYACLKKLANPEIKIITIEDPIEYHLAGISQTQVAPEKGYTFANGLKSIMRQDPDVILVGEIRDLETVEIAMQASLTGHLVFATLHTNDAAGTIARLTSLGAKALNIAPAVSMIIAQRLVRKVCPKCMEINDASEKELAIIKNELKKIPPRTDVPKITDVLRIAKPKGCKECNFTGYQGRIGIFEALVIDNELEKLILETPSIVELKERAISKGMLTMRQDGIIKVLRHITTLEEVERVTAE